MQTVSTLQLRQALSIVRAQYTAKQTTDERCCQCTAANPLLTRVAASFASISAALISDRHSCGRQNRLCTAML